MNLIPIIIIILLSLISFLPAVYRYKKISLVFLTILIAFIFRLYPDFPVQFAYFKIDNETVIWLFLYTVFVLIVQSRINHYLVPVIYGISAVLLMVTSLIPYYMLFELMVIAGTVLVIKTLNNSSLPKLYLPVSLSLSVITGLGMLLFVSTGSYLFIVLFVLLIVIRTGILPLWGMERKLFTLSPFVYSLFVVSKTMAAVMLLVKLNNIIPVPALLQFVSSAVIYIAAFTMLAGAIVVNRTRNALNYFSSLLIVPVSMLYLSVCSNLSKLTIFVNFATVIVVAVVLPLFYIHFLNKLLVDGKLSFFEFVRMKKTNMFYYIVTIGLLLLPLPFSPLLYVEYELIKNKVMNPVIGIGFILCNVAAAFVIARLANSRKLNNG